MDIKSRELYINFQHIKCRSSPKFFTIAKRALSVCNKTCSAARDTASEAPPELPPRTEITLHVKQSKEEAALYEALHQKVLERIQDESLPLEQCRFQVLTEVTRLRQACCHSKLIIPDTDIGNAKLKVFCEILIDLWKNRHKALLFSQFVKHLTLIRDYLDAEGIHYQYLDGATPITSVPPL